MQYKFMGFKLIHWDGIESIPENIADSNATIKSHLTGNLGGHKNCIIGLTLEWKIRIKEQDKQLLSGIFESRYLLNLNNNNQNILQELIHLIDNSYERTRVAWDELIKDSVIQVLSLPPSSLNHLYPETTTQILTYLKQENLIT